MTLFRGDAVLLGTALILLSGCGGSFRAANLSSKQSLATASQPLVIQPSAQAASKGTVSLEGSCNSNLSVSITGDITEPQQVDCVDGAFQASVQLAPPDGIKNVRAQQTDATGTSQADSRSFTLDTLAPAVEILTPAESQAVNGSAVVQGTCEAPFEVELKEGGSTYKVPCAANGTFAATLTLKSADGNIAVEAAQTDEALNRGSVTRQIAKDTVAPVVAIMQPAAGATVSSSASVSGTCETGLMVELSGAGVSAPVQVACTNAAFSATVVFTNGDGSKAVTATQRDAAGNSGMVSRSFNMVAQGPVLSFTAPAANSLFRDTVNVTGTCQAGLTVNFSGTGTVAPASTTCVAGTFAATISFTAGDGLKNVIASQTDSLSRTGSASRSFVRDTTAPQLAISQPAANSFVRTDVALVGTCEAGLPIVVGGAGAAATSNGTCANSAFSLTVNLSAGEGNKVITLTQTDAAGNVGTVSRTFVRDTVAPAVTISSPAEGTSAATGLTVTGTCEGTFMVTANGSGVSAPVARACANNAYSLDITFSSGDGTKAVTISQTDAAGNTGTASRNFMKAAPVSLDGIALYTSNCASCHGALATSAKIGRTAQQITEAINTQPVMAALKTLTPAQVEAIANALKPAQMVAGRKYTCSDENARGIDNTQIRRLTKTELVNTMTDIFGSSLMSNASVANALATIPNETPDDVVYEFQNLHTILHVEGMFAASEAMLNVIIPSSTEKTRIFGSCSTQATITTACVDTFIDNMGLKLFRRPVSATRKTELRNMFTAAQSGDRGLRALMMAMLMAPEFQFHLEGGNGAAPVNGRTRLDDYEVASRIAFAVTGAGPDQTLLNAAGMQQLRTIAGVRTQVERLLQVARARTRFDEVMNAWLLTSKIQDASNVMAQVAGIQADGLKAEAKTELLDYARYQLFDNNANAVSFLSQKIGFPKSSRMATIYASQMSQNNQPVTLANHGGLLLRASSLLANRNESSPILRGAYVRRRLLCDTLPSPDFSIVQQRNDELGAADRTKFSGRQIAENLTAPQTCMVCHSQINSLGFSLEAFDPLGRIRTAESVYNANGQVIATHQLNLYVSPANIETGGPATMNGANDLLMGIANSVKARACITDRFYAHNRMRALAPRDNCTLSEIEQALASGQSVKEAYIRSVANEDIFWRKDIGSQ